MLTRSWKCTVSHKSHDLCIHVFFMEARVMTFVAHCTSKGSNCIFRLLCSTIHRNREERRREPHRERVDNFFPRCALIRGMYQQRWLAGCKGDVAVDASLPMRLSRARHRHLTKLISSNDHTAYYSVVAEAKSAVSGLGTSEINDSETRGYVSLILSLRRKVEPR